MSKKTVLILLLLLSLSLIFGSASQAAPGAAAQDYAIKKWSVDVGGGASSGGGYWLAGTVGQPDAGVLSGGIYDLTGGFWGGVVASGLRHNYLPVTIR
jgi:hypothetical protein